MTRLEQTGVGGVADVAGGVRHPLPPISPLSIQNIHNNTPTAPSAPHQPNTSPLPSLPQPAVAYKTSQNSQPSKNFIPQIPFLAKYLILQLNWAKINFATLLVEKMLIYPQTSLKKLDVADVANIADVTNSDSRRLQ